jgi:hypothetical protein
MAKALRDRNAIWVFERHGHCPRIVGTYQHQPRRMELA